MFSSLKQTLKLYKTVTNHQNIIRVISASSYNNHHNENQAKWSKTVKNLIAAVCVGSAYFCYTHANAEASTSIFSSDEVSKHTDKKQGVWVTYKGNVYDITKFVDQHPGGKKILLAAGGALEPYWAVYGMHNSSEVRELLEEYRIGSLSKEDAQKIEHVAIDDPFSKDPSRHPALKPASIKPYNAEPPAGLLVDNFKTPNALFYVRNHMPVPEVDEKTFKLTVMDINNKNKSLTLDELKKLPKVTITAAVQCAGNRRSEMSKIKPVKGLSWGPAAIGNADWTGVRLVDVLSYCGFTKDAKIKHVHFYGLDSGLDGVSYAASVPAFKALDPQHDVILAYEMNGEPLPRDHGAPLRVIVPGVVGARNVKWLGKVVLSQHESDSHWQQNDYKGLPPGADWDSADFSKAVAIQELPISSAICVPEDGDTIEIIDGTVTVKGYAWSGGGRQIVRVDVSADSGKTWHQAELDFGKDVNNNENCQWSWTLWTASIPVNPTEKKVTLWAKAVDDSYNTQPESFGPIWNFRGVLGNAYHKIQVTTN